MYIYNIVVYVQMFVIKCDTSTVFKGFGSGININQIKIEEPLKRGLFQTYKKKNLYIKIFNNFVRLCIFFKEHFIANR